MDRDEITEIERTLAVGERRIVDVVARLDPSYGSMTFDLADGIAVLAGDGLYVNQVMAAGLSRTLTADDVDHLERLAGVVGVVPAFDVCDVTRPDVVALLRARGYEPDDERLVVVHDLAEVPVVQHPYRITFVGDDELREWQEACAAGWGHVNPDRRSASDLYAAAAHEADHPGLLLARDHDGRAVGAAMLRIDGRVAYLGGMSTRPHARGRGVQSALVAHRLAVARAEGCEYATSTVEPAGGSMRNLVRLGFAPSHTRVTWVRR